MMQKSQPIRDFVYRGQISYEEVQDLLENGEAEFSYFDTAIRGKRRIKAICSQKPEDGSGVRYVMLYNLNRPLRESGNETAGAGRICIRTFGYFDVFVEGKPIAFRNKKSKELLALLVDRRGVVKVADFGIA